MGKLVFETAFDFRKARLDNVFPVRMALSNARRELERATQELTNRRNQRTISYTEKNQELFLTALRLEREKKADVEELTARLAELERRYSPANVVIREGGRR